MNISGEGFLRRDRALKHILFCLLGLGLMGQSAARSAVTIGSPDGQLRVTLEVSGTNKLRYAVTRGARAVILPSELGMQLEGADLASDLVLTTVSPLTPVRQQYRMAVGKRSKIDSLANEQTISLENPRHQKLDVIFRVANDGVAFRYRTAGSGAGRQRMLAESTAFAFGAGTRAWLQPMSVAQTGWKNTNPAYEEHYLKDIAAGTPSPSPAGWVFPALFRSGATWVAISEADMDGSFHAARLQADSRGSVYRIGAPSAPEVFSGGALLAESDGVLRSPWRLMAIGSLATVAESTLGTDLAAPAVAFDAALVKPGHASWSWALLKDDATVYDVQKRFIDYAADMHWDYTLIDADWDRKIGYDKVKELVDYAATKKVGILLWYNSSGPWNQTGYTPKSALLTHARRAAEFARLRELGVKGVKIDFFGGDGQSMIAYYVDILRDAADAGLLVNFHGATLPRGWSRTWPNLMTAEAIKGFEFATFEQPDQDAVASHAAMLPFTRNLFDPMDFTPMVFGDIPKIKRGTRNGFELALSVLFLSGIQHFAETPDGMATVPSYVKAFLQQLPASWDDMKLVDGEPGKFVVVARRAGDTWYVAGINAEATPRTLTLALPFVGKRKGVLITDGKGEREFAQGPFGKRMTIAPRGGFVALFK